MAKITEEKLNKITNYIICEIMRNPHIMYNEFIQESDIDIIGVIASLHNLLYEAVTGERYDYMFHWANKLGGWCYDDLFDESSENYVIEED
jgi:hypothetical protein